MYRDAHPADHARFAQHVALAEMKLRDYRSFHERVRLSAQITPVDPASLDRLADQACDAWYQMWQQLVEARAIVAAAGRDTSVFDSAREDIADLDIAKVDRGAWRLGFLSVERTLTYQAASDEAPTTAIEALRAAMPEVVIPTDDGAPAPVLARSFPWALVLALFAVIAALIGLAISK